MNKIPETNPLKDKSVSSKGKGKGKIHSFKANQARSNLNTNSHTTLKPNKVKACFGLREQHAQYQNNLTKQSRSKNIIMLLGQVHYLNTLMSQSKVQAQGQGQGQEYQQMINTVLQDFEVALPQRQSELQATPYEPLIRAQVALLRGFICNDPAEFEQSIFELEALAERAPNNPLIPFFGASLWHSYAVRFEATEHATLRAMRLCHSALQGDYSDYLWHQNIRHCVNQLGLEQFSQLFRQRGSVADEFVGEGTLSLRERLDLLMTMLGNLNQWRSQSEKNPLNQAHTWILQLYLATGDYEQGLRRIDEMLAKLGLGSYAHTDSQIDLARYELAFLSELDQQEERRLLLEEHIRLHDNAVFNH